MATSPALSQAPVPPQWVLDLTSPPATKSKNTSIVDPPGYTSAAPTKRGTGSTKQPQPPARRQPTPEEMDTLKLKKAWEIAIAPAKQIPVQGIGMYMTGNSLQVFSIFMVFTLFKTPLQSIISVNRAFAPFETDGTRSNLIMVKLAYIVCNLLTLALGIYKVNAMGLLPTTRSDWLAWETQRTPMERAYPA